MQLHCCIAHPRAQGAPSYAQLAGLRGPPALCNDPVNPVTCLKYSSGHLDQSLSDAIEDRLAEVAVRSNELCVADFNATTDWAQYSRGWRAAAGRFCLVCLLFAGKPEGC